MTDDQTEATRPGFGPAMPPPMPTTPPSPKARTRRAFLAGTAAGAALVGAAWLITASTAGSSLGPGSAKADGKPVTAASSSAESSFALNGEFVLTDGTADDGTGGCKGTGGYDDIGMGTSVTVYDASGTTIATSSLVTSTWDQAAGTCTFNVFVDDVPGGHKFYQVEISHRGKVQISAEDARAGAFSASLG